MFNNIEMEESSEGVYEEFEIKWKRKCSFFIKSKWRLLIRGTVEDSDDSGG